MTFLPDRTTPLTDILPYQKPAIRKIDHYILELGGGRPALGRERFLACLLLTAHTDDRLDALLAYTEDPSYSSRSIGELAIACGFRAGELIKILKETGLLVAQSHSIQIVAESLPAVTRDVVTRAQNHYEPCSSCNATGKFTPEPTKDLPNPSPQPCEACAGVGQILVQADPGRQDVVLEIAKMLPSKEKSSGQTTNIGIGLGGGDHKTGSSAPAFGSLLTQLIAATDRINHPDRGRSTIAQPVAVAPAATVADESPVEPLEAEVVSSPADDPTPSTSSPFTE